MISASDREYKSTKRIKQGKTRLAPPFDELSQWIKDTRKVSVLNVVYDRRNSLHAPRIQVILEYEEDVQKFRSGYNFDENEQNSIAEKFLQIIYRNDMTEFDVDGLFVVFSGFSRIAKQEADSKVSEKEIDSLQARIGNPDLWVISRLFGRVTFFFYTDAQVKHYEKIGKREAYAKMYFDILKPHDEFNYLREEDFRVSFDSKHNFDKKYKGSWFNYYR